jgi:hypothetical protein
MPSFLRRHLSYANVTATMALVLAMGGSALAASKEFTAETKSKEFSYLITALTDRKDRPGSLAQKGHRASKARRATKANRAKKARPASRAKPVRGVNPVSRAKPANRAFRCSRNPNRKR